MSTAWTTPFCCILVIALISTPAFAAEDVLDCSNQKIKTFYRTDDCIGWFMCEYGKTKRMPDCPGGLVFSLKMHTCVRRGDPGDDCIPGKCTGQQDGTIIPNEDNCTGWYTCVDGGAVKMSDTNMSDCGLGMVFSREMVTCVPQGSDYDDCTPPGDTIITLNGTVHELPTENNLHMLDISKKLVYQGKSFSRLYISKDGIVGFSSTLRYRQIDWSNLASVSSFVDKPFIAPYHYSAVALDIHGYTGKVRYKILLPTNTDGSQTLVYLGNYIRSLVVGSFDFKPTWGLIVTWVNVTSSQELHDGECHGTKLDPCKMNTFQLVLLSNETESYAIFNYGAMKVPIRKYDQAGFNGGDGTGWTNILNHGLKGLCTHQSSDTEGRYIFKISTGKILRGGCTTDPMTRSLSVYPSYAGMYGGKVVDISGPCFIRYTNMKCKFGAHGETTAMFVSRTQVRCVVPRMLEHGRITLGLSTDGGRWYAYHTPFFIVFPGRIPTNEQVEPIWTSNHPAWYGIKPAILELSWHPQLLSNLTTPQVDITLFGYREHNGQAKYSPLLKLDSIRVGAGKYTIDPKTIQCKGDTCSDYELGILEVKLKDDRDTPAHYRYLSSKAIPLGWYVNTAMTSQYGANWPGSKCTDWYNADRLKMSWQNDLPSCPCTLRQSIADFGRWQPDVSCNLQQKSVKGNCFYHNKAVQCARSIQPVGGAGVQCCYDAQGQLLYAADSFQGSTPDRSHSWGAAPYLKTGQVPALSHYLRDVVSFYYCCIWTKFSHCDYYMDQRPTMDCTAYTPPSLASAYGQGNVITFSGVRYRVLGPGDYTILKADNTTIQARFENNPFPNQAGTKITSSYVLTAVVIQDVGSSSKVEIRLRGPVFNTQHQKLDVRVNGEYISFNAAELFWQDFKGISVVNTDIKRNVHSNYTVIMANGVGIQVAESSGTLQLDVMVPGDTFMIVSGLFGGLSSNALYPNGSHADIQNIIKHQAPVSFYKKFQLAWAVKENACLFPHLLPADHSLTVAIDFSPTAMPGTNNWKSICSRLPSTIANTCIFDYKSTASGDIAQGTIDAELRHMSLTVNLKFAHSCGLLNVPRSTKNNHNYLLGSQVTVTGCRSGSLSGATVYQCLSTSNTTQEWSPAVTATCQEQTEDTNVGIIVLIVLIVLIVVAIVVIVVIIVIIFRRREKHGASYTVVTPSGKDSGRKKSGSAPHKAETEPMQTTSFEETLE